MRWIGPVAAMAFGLALASCRFIPTADVKTIADAGSGNKEAEFNPAKMVEAIWQTKVAPYFQKKAGPLDTVRDLAAKSPDQAGAKYGYRGDAEGMPWTLAVRIEGVIVAADTQSREATIGVDTSGKGVVEATVQIGPAIRGTAIRDALSFVSFNDFVNQIDFARYGKAFNTHVNRTTLEKLPRDGLVGRKVTVVGAYALGAAGDVPLVTPVEISVGAKP